MITLRAEVEQELEERRVELAKAEERARRARALLDQKDAELIRREQGVDDRETHARAAAGGAQGGQGGGGARRSSGSPA